MSLGSSSQGTNSAEKPKFVHASPFKPTANCNFGFMTDVSCGAPVFKPSGYVFNPGYTVVQSQPMVVQQQLVQQP